MVSVCATCELTVRIGSDPGASGAKGSQGPVGSKSVYSGLGGYNVSRLILDYPSCVVSTICPYEGALDVMSSSTT